MKFPSKSIAVLALYLCSFGVANAVKPLAVFNYKVFYTPDNKPLVETYFDISAHSITLIKQESGLFMGQVELTVIFKKNGEIITFDKKCIKSPEMEGHRPVDFIDVERFALEPGKYKVEIVLRDIVPETVDRPSNDTTLAEQNSSTLLTSVIVPPAGEGAFFSDIELISALRKAKTAGELTKSGYDLVPMVSDSLLKTQMKEVVFYTELYGMNRRVGDSLFLLKTYLQNTTTQAPVESTVKFTRKATAPVTPVLATMDISEVPEGAYEITVEARDRNNELLARAVHPVHRLKTESPDVYATTVDPSKTWVAAFTDPNELYTYLNALRPIAGDKDLSVMDTYFLEVENTQLVYLQRFFYAFWEARAPGKGQEAWLEYKEKVDFVEQEFATRNKHGFETDRGRIYLKYGAPNHIAKRTNEPGSYPYEIWQYYKTEQFNNARFVFYDPTLLDTEYELLHSEGVRGETVNPRWKYLLQKRSLPEQNIDDKEGVDHFGSRADDYFNNPR